LAFTQTKSLACMYVHKELGSNIEQRKLEGKMTTYKIIILFYTYVIGLHKHHCMCIGIRTYNVKECFRQQLNVLFNS
jgi:hypothetical protein